jgi:hypothetical protein
MQNNPPLNRLRQLSEPAQAPPRPAAIRGIKAAASDPRKPRFRLVVANSQVRAV